MMLSGKLESEFFPLFCYGEPVQRGFLSDGRGFLARPGGLIISGSTGRLFPPLILSGFLRCLFPGTGCWM
jgi:hypothetical protein